MYRYTLRRAAATTAGFSSASFTGDSSDAGARLRAEQARLQAEHTNTNTNPNTNTNTTANSRENNHDEDNNNNNNSSKRSSKKAPPPFDAQLFQHSNQVKYTGDSAYYASFSDSDHNHHNASSQQENQDPATARDGRKPAAATESDRPTRSLYETMSDEALLDLFQKREEQVRQLRAVYEQFHYHCDKNYRKMIFDYHDKAAQLSQVHGRMQAASLQINREALKQMREQQEMYERDKRIVFCMSGLVVFLFWVWVRRHYIAKKEVLSDYEQVNSHNFNQLQQKQGQEGGEPIPYVDATYERIKHSPSVLGSGSYNENIFTSAKRSARTWETTWEREVREKREKAYREKIAAQQRQSHEKEDAAAAAASSQQPQAEKKEKKA